MVDYEVLTQIPVERLIPEQTAFLVIDMQRYFVRPEHPFGKASQLRNLEEAKAYFGRVRDVVVPNIQRLLETCRARDLCITYTEFGSARQDGRDMPGWARRINDRGRQTVGAPIFPPFDDPSCRVDDSLAPRVGELVVQKSTSGPVNSTKLDQTLRVLGVNTVLVTGVVTDVCVAQTAREFADRDFMAIVIEDACAATERLRHKPALATIGRVFGAVASTEQILDLLKR